MTRGRKPKAGAVRRGISPAQAACPPSTGHGIAMPPCVAADPVQSQYWSWLVGEGHAFSQRDVPLLVMLVEWYAVFEQCRQGMRTGDGTVQVLERVGTIRYADEDDPDMTLSAPAMREHPLVRVMKQASAEIRGISSALGLDPLSSARLGLTSAAAANSVAETRQRILAIMGEMGGA